MDPGFIIFYNNLNNIEDVLNNNIHNKEKYKIYK